MYTVEQLAELLQVHANTVRGWLATGKLHGVRLGGKAGWRVRASEFERFLKERES